MQMQNIEVVEFSATKILKTLQCEFLSNSHVKMLCYLYLWYKINEIVGSATCVVNLLVSYYKSMLWSEHHKQHK
jgi:hypothetical protein